MTNYIFYFIFINASKILISEAATTGLHYWQSPFFSLVISFQTLSDVQLSRPLLSGRGSRSKLSPFQFYRQSAPEPLSICNNTLKSFLTHSHTKPLLAHYTLIVFTAPFDISLIKKICRKPPL